MAKLYNESYLIGKAERRTRQTTKTFSQLIHENNNQYDSFDIFLSHSSDEDERVIYGLVAEFLDMGYTTYVYWIVDTHMVQRSSVDKQTSLNLKKRLNQSDTLFYATSKNTIESKWMPWELGYMDGLREKCAVLPIEKGASIETIFKGQEYLSLYPYVIKEEPKFLHQKTGQLWICDDEKKCIEFDEWKKGYKPKWYNYPTYSLR